MRSRSWRVGFATGKLAPLLAQALVLEDAHGQRTVLVTTNVTGFDYDVQTWRLSDELTVVGMEGEVSAPWRTIARGLANTPHAALIGYVNATRARFQTQEKSI